MFNGNFSVERETLVIGGPIRRSYCQLVMATDSVMCLNVTSSTKAGLEGSSLPEDLHELRAIRAS